MSEGATHILCNIDVFRHVKQHHRIQLARCNKLNMIPVVRSVH